eukprot:CAMPEP_0197563102 /NCGR_PEP_ID=MMETSP1320-20131121/28128_1 /TAXON_ID=91990 /ORGANISM="Bolidomonas sp., Strain RCC2347" /LENGTH=227 /DNA_ID=CAMNT_0043124883 /DNA_START=39 /DNA_END=719 /DNA_ORIENTATION=-
MTCAARGCGQEFCFYHSNSHVGMTCEKYEETVAAEMRLNEEYLSKFTKPCPQCKTLVQKSGGCNQMKCTKCGVHFCWLCNAQVDSGTFPAHFQWWNVGGCPNMQMNESIEPSRWEVTRGKLLAIFQIAFLGPPSFALTVASSILCCLCLPAMGDYASERFENCMSLWGNLLTLIIALPVLLALGATMVAFSCFYFVFACFRVAFCGLVVEKGDDDEGSPEKPKGVTE